MAHTYSQMYIHCVFSVKGRENIISKKWNEELYKYICGIVNNNQQKIYSINGMPDHLHILISIRPDVSFSHLIREIKASSSKWINTNKLVKGKFTWQEGFSAFSVSHSQLDKVIAYINNQEIHHQTKTFQQEYIEFLKSHKIEYDERYVFDLQEGDVAPTGL